MLLAAEGLTDKEIAKTLGISHATVTTHWVRVRERSGARSRGEALMKILGENLRETARVAEQALEDRDILLEQAQDFAVFSTDPKGTILDWNNGVNRVLGYSEPEFVGQNLAIIFSPEEARNGIPEWEMQQARERGRFLDKRWHFKKDGTQIWVHGYLVALLDKETGEVRRFAKIIRDDTERKGLEEEVQRLQAIVAKAGDRPTTLTKGG
jgi:PAS domain S-box-containing protein